MSFDPRLDEYRPVCFMCGKLCNRKDNTGFVECDLGAKMSAHLTCLDNQTAFDIYVKWKKAVDAAMVGKSERGEPIGRVKIDGDFV